MAASERTVIRQMRKLTRPSRWLTVGAVGVVVVTAAVIALVLLWPRTDRFTVRIGGGPEGGTWLLLGQGLCDIINQRAEYPHIAGAEVAVSQGSLDNMNRLTDPANPTRVDFAFIQADTRGTGDVRLVARLHDNIMQIVVRRDRKISDIYDLAGKTVNTGAEQSGTRAVAVEVFKHLGISVTERTQNYSESASALLAGEVDAACYLAGLHTEVVHDLLLHDTVDLLAIGDAERAGSTLDGLRVGIPSLKPAVIPAHTYGLRPAAPVGTVAVTTLFVTRADVPDDLVREVTQALFENRSQLLHHHAAAAQFAEHPDRGDQPYPWHPGALAHYDRNAPHWVVRYAEALSFALGIMFALGSTLVAIRQWLHRVRKNRIDVYYLELGEIAERITPHATPDQLRALLDRLHEIRRRAFTELVAERLEADSSFVIFLNYLLAEIATAEKFMGAQEAIMA